MIREIVMPQLAMGMSEGTILEWAVAEGDFVERDATALSIETEKVSTELPSPYKGYLHIVEDVGATVPVEQLIAYIASSEQEYAELVKSRQSGGAASLSANQDSCATPAVPESAALSTDSGPVKGRVKVSRLAKKIAQLKGVELATVNGTGPGGRIVRRDIESALEAKRSVVGQPAVSSVAGMVERARIPLTGMRGAIAKSVAQASTEAVHTNTFAEVDVTKLLAARETMLAREQELGVRVPLNAFVIKALAMASRYAPALNATIDDKSVTLWQNVNVAIAVATQGSGEYDSGIAMPVLKNAENKSVVDIAREMKDLVARARSGQLSSDDVSDYTMMLSSTTGMVSNNSWSISAPILKLPAIFAFQPGTPLKKPVVIDGQIVARDMLPCGATFDHRATDGVPVGLFMQKLQDLLSNPELML